MSENCFRISVNKAKIFGLRKTETAKLLKMTFGDRPAFFSIGSEGSVRVTMYPRSEKDVISFPQTCPAIYIHVSMNK